MIFFNFKRNTVQLYIAILTGLVFGILSPSLSTASSERGVLLRAKLEKESGRKVGTYRALIIGINDYRDSKIPGLKTPVNDTKALANILKKDYGFEDIALLQNKNANASNIEMTLRYFITRSQKDDSVLIYYAGHGELDELTGSGWWIPYDARARDPSTYIDNSVIQKYIKAIPARHVLLVVDSCFAGTLFGETRSLPRMIRNKWYSTLFKNRSRWGFTSGNLTPVTDRGMQGHSIFAYQFIKALKENQNPFLTPREIYAQIGPIIRNNSEQMPIVKPILNTNDQGGEFVFIRTTSLAPVAPPPPPPQKVAKLEKIQPIPSPPFTKKDEVLKGDIFIESDPSEAMVYLDGTRRSRTPVQLKDVPAGKHFIELRKGKTYSAKLQINLEPDDFIKKKIKLIRSKKFDRKNRIGQMALIKGGCFDMGDTFGDEDSDETPAHMVCVDNYYLGKHEVTQREWRDIMGKNPSIFKNCGTDCPVENVSWSDIQEFITRLNKKTGKNHRLPTEAEWEFAAREGGRRTKYSGFYDESDLHKYANFCDVNCRYGWKTTNQNDKYSNVAPVGHYKPNSLGLFDMIGNVWEWVSDRYGKKYYKKSPRNNPTGPKRGHLRVIRGGSWYSRLRSVRVTNRLTYDPAQRLSHVGFRLARSATKRDR